MKLLYIFPALILTGCGAMQNTDNQQNFSYRYQSYADAQVLINESNNRSTVQLAAVQASQGVTVKLPEKAAKKDCTVDETEFKELCEGETAKEVADEAVCGLLRQELDRRKEACEEQPEHEQETEVTFSGHPSQGANYNFAGATIIGPVILESPGAYGGPIEKKSTRSRPLPESVVSKAMDKAAEVVKPLIQWGAIFGIADQVSGAISDVAGNAGARYTNSNNPDLSDNSVTTTTVSEDGK